MRRQLVRLARRRRTGGLGQALHVEAALGGVAGASLHRGDLPGPARRLLLASPGARSNPARRTASGAFRLRRCQFSVTPLASGPPWPFALPNTSSHARRSASGRWRPASCCMMAARSSHAKPSSRIASDERTKVGRRSGSSLVARPTASDAPGCCATGGRRGRRVVSIARETAQVKLAWIFHAFEDHFANGVLVGSRIANSTTLG